MFTGLIKEIGVIKNIKKIGDGAEITVLSSTVIQDANIDDSIAINGVCLTVVAVDNNSFTVQAVKESLQITTLNKLKLMEKVNLEPAMKVSDRLGGHIVQGHVDAKGKILRIINNMNGTEFTISFPNDLKKYIVHKGSICVDGISLTIAEVNDNTLRLAIIPHTLKQTTAVNWKTGIEVNIETDIIGRYIESMLKEDTHGLTMNRLSELGY
ncbi:MAG: riboflavin synthase [Candidatus Delongbacteria bacterium]|jgi:riboflavin synthase|nr:riboflavin synthase [Candidatus Delongbacteria bacterium]